MEEMIVNKSKYKMIALPKLTGLRPTLESTCLKLMEESGELAQAIGKMRSMNGEKNVESDIDVYDHMAKELMDVAQVAISMMFILEEDHGIHIDSKVSDHIQKLKDKGYLL